MLSQVNQAGQQRGNRRNVADASRIWEFPMMNLPDFTSSSVIEDLNNFMENFQKVFEVMHVVDVKRVELVHTK